MSHTNSTTNYNLPQFIGTDKPTWLNDVNSAMSTIDTQMKANADSATSAGTSATTANNAIGTISNLNTTTKTDLVSAINEVNTNLSTASGVASQASADASEAKSGIADLYSYFNFTQTGTVTASITNGTFDWQTFEQAVNADGSLGKIYGSSRCKRTNSTNDVTITIPTAFRPKQTINVNGVCWMQESDNQFDNYSILVNVTLTIETNGNITLTPPIHYNSYGRIYFFACMIFADNFGDTPVTPNA